MSENYTDSRGAAAETGTRGAVWEKNSEVFPAQLTAYAPAVRESGDTSPSTSSFRPGTRKNAGPDKESSDLAKRDAVRRAVARAGEEAGRMVEAAKEANLMELSNAGFRLASAMDEIWALRGDREESWGDLLNLLQGAIKRLDFESFTVPQCAAIREVISHLGLWTVEDDDIRSSIRSLRQAGFDPWRGISGSPESK